jgi:hypothetical protein
MLRFAIGTELNKQTLPAEGVPQDDQIGADCLATTGSFGSSADCMDGLRRWPLRATFGLSVHRGVSS